MAIYNVNGVIIDNSIDVTETPYLSSSAKNNLKEQSDFDMSGFDVIRTFTAFETDYACNTSQGRGYDVLPITSSEFYNTFYEPYLGKHDDLMVTKKNLGKDQSGTYDIWCYDFIPYNAKKKILLSSGMHTYELPASFGLARWVKDFMESSDAVFQYMRQNVHVSIIPIVNPWGWNQNPKKYGNVNGVNPNRNFNNWNNVWASFPDYSPIPTDPNYNEWNVKGEEPFSEAETQILCKWLKNNTDAQFWIDCHTGAKNKRSATGDVWCIYVGSSNVLATKIQTGATAIGGYIQSTYNTTPKYNIVTDSPNSIKSMYGDQVVSIPTMVIEMATETDTLMTTWPNNSKPAIQYYALQIHAYIVAQLQ